MSHIPYCIACVGEPFNTLDGSGVDFVNIELSGADTVINFLQSTYDRFATLIADGNAERSDDERIDLTTIGGFGIKLTNRFGSEIETALGRRFCLVIRLKPLPTRIYRTITNQDGTLVFYLDGWHHTEMEISNLVTRDECLACLRGWLEANVFPASV